MCLHLHTDTCQYVSHFENWSIIFVVWKESSCKLRLWYINQISNVQHSSSFFNNNNSYIHEFHSLSINHILVIYFTWTLHHAYSYEHFQLYLIQFLPFSRKLFYMTTRRVPLVLTMHHSTRNSYACTCILWFAQKTTSQGLRMYASDVTIFSDAIRVRIQGVGACITYR